MSNLVISTPGAMSQAKTEITEDLYRQFVDYLQVTQKTKDTYTRALRQLMRHFSFKGITQPTRADLIAWREELRATGHQPTTVQSYLAAARGFFDWTEEMGLYPNIARRVKSPKVSPLHKKDNLTAQQAQDVLNHVKRDALRGLRDYALLALMLTTGMRTIEITRANVEDLRPRGDSTVLYVQGKGREDKAEYVKIMQPTEAAIREYLRARGDVSGDAPLFASISNHGRGRRLSTRSVSGLVKARLIEAGYNSKRLTAHSLRHTAVTLSFSAGKPAPEVQEFARHTSLNTTMIYNHELSMEKNTCAEAVTRAIFPFFFKG